MNPWTRASLALPLALIVFPQRGLADPELEFPPVESRWSVSAGVTVRSLNAAFDVRPGPSLADWRNFLPAPGHGDPGVFTGSGQPVVYDNGVAGGQSPSFAGFGAIGKIDSASQISPIHSGVNTNGNLARTVSFQSLSYEEGNRFQTSTDGSANLGPSLQFAYRLGESMGTKFELQTGWSFISSETSSGPLEILPVYQVSNTYLYDYVANPQAQLGSPGTVDGPDQFLVYDTAALPSFFGTGYQDPRRGAAQRGSEPYAVALSSADLDTRLIEIPFGLNAWRDFGPLQLGFNGGLTLNVLDYDLESRFAWFQGGGDTAAAQFRWNQSGTHLKVGLFAGLSARLPLSDDKRVFLEASGSYRWIDPVHAAAGPVDVEIDASSAEGRFGVGIVLW